MSLSFTIGASTITVFLDGEIHTVDSSHINFQPLMAELKKDPDERDLNEIRTYVSIRRAIEAMSYGDVAIDGETVSYKGEVMTGYLATRMLEIIQQGIGIEPWANFMANVMRNPSETARKELYEWLEKAKLPITPDGHFIAFKKVRADFTDCHTGKFDNSVGSILEMDRSLCDPNRHNTCSTGFHWCSPGYLSHFSGQQVIAVKINPRDVTAIPPDYNTTKGRACRYEVVAALKNEEAARHGAWTKKAVVDLEDPAEFPDLLIKQTAPVEKKVLKSDGEKVTRTKKAETAKKPTAKKVAKAVKKIGKKLAGMEFKTTTGRTYTGQEVFDAVKDSASGREAARLLGIGESTLRGWKKSLGL